MTRAVPSGTVSFLAIQVVVINAATVMLSTPTL